MQGRPPTPWQVFLTGPDARRTFDGLSYSNKSWHTLQIEGAKTDETRERRLAKSIEALRAGRPR